MARNLAALEVAELLTSLGYPSIAKGKDITVLDSPFLCALEIASQHPPGPLLMRAYLRALEKSMADGEGKAPVGIYTGQVDGLRDVLAVVPMWFLARLLKFKHEAESQAKGTRQVN